MSQRESTRQSESRTQQVELSGPTGPPSPPSLPKGGGAIRGIGETFSTNPVTGTAGMTIPIVTSPGRSGFGPRLALSYDSGAGNGPFGLGWSLGLPAITRKTDRGLPRYDDGAESDTFVLSGAEDLVRTLRQDQSGAWVLDTFSRDGFTVQRYRPRIEGMFARIERWSRQIDGDTYWRAITRENVTTFYGRTAESRIADPADPSRVFSWLICASYDDKGNAILYEYKPEDSARIFEDTQGQTVAWAHERNRTAGTRAANRYIKRIRYGNRVSNRDPDGDPIDPATLTDWMFDVVFDYGDGHFAPLPPSNGQAFVSATMTSTAGTTWPARQDPFSTFRSGFDLRTYRLCQRVLMFHHFPQELGRPDYLVRSTEFTYRPSDILTVLTSVSQSGYLSQPSQSTPDGYLRASLPPLDLEYSDVPSDTELAQLPVETPDPESLANLPIGIDEERYRWVDLDGEGSPGILTQQAGAWFYKRNSSAINQVTDGGVEARTVARFDPIELVSFTPAGGLRQGQLMDLAGDGQLDLVRLAGPRSGFFERTQENWSAFRPFRSFPNLNTRDANLRWVDLNGDGQVDILLTEDEALTWYPSLGEDGFGPAIRLANSLDEERGPRLVFSDATGSVVLADLSGDGSADLARIRNGEVCYWPNLGYGRFGAKITMDSAPVFDLPDQFDARHIRLADTDGSGVTDIIYVGAQGVSIYLNLAGNAWSEGIPLPQFPAAARDTTIEALDLLGSGTACLVWSSPRAQDDGSSLRYVDLMKGQKPHLLTGYTTGMGREVEITYRPSTYFYLADRRAGTPWRTRLPFPVHCVSTTTIRDRVRETVFSSSVSYHHGYYDGTEREFRGFGRVDQLDTESVAAFKQTGAANVVEDDLLQPPVRTTTWYHPGALPTEGGRSLHQMHDEYYANGVAPEYELPEPSLPTNLDAAEFREALRSLKGVQLRQEVFAQDGSSQQVVPYTTATSSYQIIQLQPRGANREACFHVIGGEGLTYYYERDPADPRVAHSMVLEIDDLGLVQSSVAIAYPRRVPDPTLPPAVAASQAQRVVTLSEIDYTNDVLAADTHRLRVACERRAWEVTGLPGPSSGMLTGAAVRQALTGAIDLAFEEAPAGGGVERRLVGRSLTLFREDDLSGPMPKRTQGALGITYEGYRLAITTGLVTQQYGTAVTDGMLTDAGYVHPDSDANWWLPTGVEIFAADAPSRWYLATGFRDPLGGVSSFQRDDGDLLVKGVTDAMGNASSAEYDYRTLSPQLVTDANQNQSAVELDVLGVVVRAAVMGKAGANDGDTLADPTSRVEYDLFNWATNSRPNYMHVFSREQHGLRNPRWQERYVYSDGAGQPVMTKVQAEPGLAKRFNPVTGQVDEIDTSPDVRWVGNGRVIVNNKGSPVKEYEPFFSIAPAYETERELVETGVTPVVYYDPLGRSVRTEFPNGTLIREEFTPWVQRHYDANDTVFDSQWYVDRGSPDPTAAEPADPEVRAAWLAAKHANTPSEIHSDTLGRKVYGIADNGPQGKRGLRTVSDLTGRVVSFFDTRERRIASTFTNLIGTPVHAESAERGERWFLTDVLGNPVRAWDDQGRVFLSTFDALHRPLSTQFQSGGATPTVINHIVYGELHPQATELNLRGRPCRLFDPAGEVVLDGFDFKGNLTGVARRFAGDYKKTPDWSAVAAANSLAASQAAAEPLLELETFSGAAEYDAFNRVIETQLADQTVLRLSYNEAGYLERLAAQVRGQGAFTTYLVDQDYDAKGQRQQARYANSTTAQYVYDPLTFRVRRILTRKNGDPENQSLQDLLYVYDPVGNLTQVRDDAQQTHYFNNTAVKPESRFEYDAIYQLVRASGREHAGIGGTEQRTEQDLPVNPLPHPNDAAAVRTYTELYDYDDLGNLLSLRHIVNGGGWTQRYRYAYQDNANDRTNRLSATSLPGDAPAGPFSAKYTYDALGNMATMPHLMSMTWNALEQLQAVNLGGGGIAYYVYGNSGQRMRKVIERIGGTRLERRYLGACEIFRRFGANGLRLERQTVSIADEHGRIAQVDTKTVDPAASDPAPLNLPVARFQYSNHLGSGALETDENANPISYEEYHPYGTSAYRSSAPTADVSLKRYRFLGKERDETQLYHLGARYYAPWLGRWTSPDPIGLAGGVNQYCYGNNNPSVFTDSSGTNGKKPKPGDLNPQGQVSWVVPKEVRSVEAFKNWLPPDNPERPYDPSSVTMKMVQRGRHTVPVFNADWLDPKTARSALPKVGEPGYVTSWGQQPPAKYGDPSDKSTRLTENEHGTPRAQQKLSGVPDADSKTTPTYRAPRDFSLNKTTVDNQSTATLKQNAAQGKPINYVDDVVMKSRDNGLRANEETGNQIRSESINRQASEELSRRFKETKLQDVESEIEQWESRQGSSAPQPTTAPGGGGFWGTAGAYGKGIGLGLARGLIPGFVEAEMGAVAAPYVVGSLGISSPMVVNAAMAMAAAPTATAFTVVGSAVGGYVVGDMVEGFVSPRLGRVAGVASGTAAGALTGAAIGAAIGSIVPVLGTGVGAAVGAIVGGIAGFIGSFW
jgi:RHS repeat-associated protein